MGRLTHVATPMHGIERRDGDGLWWWQYWTGVGHVWYWHGIPVWYRLRRRDRPMYEFTRRISGGW